MSESEAARVLVITGPGKGKTTAALGIVLRGLSYGEKVLLTRFTKAAHSGELDIFEKLPNITVLSGKYGMTPHTASPEYPAHVAAARELFDATCEAAPEYDLIVMDEICGVAARGMVGQDEVVRFVRGLRPDQTVVLTGRGAGEKLLAVADTVSEILCIKHGYQRGINAQKGVEF